MPKYKPSENQKKSTRSPSKNQQIFVQKRGTHRKGNYILEETIGEGAFAKVKLATHIYTGEKVAIKILNKEKLMEDNFDDFNNSDNGSDIQKIRKEINILKRLKHKNVIQLYEIMESKSNLYIVMEYCEGKELFDYIVKKKYLSEIEACSFFQQIIDGVEYLHLSHITHRDLKPENLLLDSKKRICISDFGLSNMTKNIDSLLETPCGTPSYAPPEMLRGEQYNGVYSDIWSCGIILYTMLVGNLPCAESKEDLIYENIMTHNYYFPDTLSDEAIDLIENMLKIDPNERYGFEQIKEHPWFNLITPKLNPGIVYGVHKIPIDEKILEKVESYGYNKEKCLRSIQNNKYDPFSSIYYLILQQFVRDNIPSISDLYSNVYLSYLKDYKNWLKPEEMNNPLYKNYDVGVFDLENILENNSSLLQFSSTTFLSDKNAIPFLQDDKNKENYNNLNKEINPNKVVKKINSNKGNNNNKKIYANEVEKYKINDVKVLNDSMVEEKNAEKEKENDATKINKSEIKENLSKVTIKNNDKKDKNITNNNPVSSKTPTQNKKLNNKEKSNQALKTKKQNPINNKTPVKKKHIIKNSSYGDLNLNNINIKDIIQKRVKNKKGSVAEQSRNDNILKNAFNELYNDVIDSDVTKIYTKDNLNLLMGLNVNEYTNKKNTYKKSSNKKNIITIKPSYKKSLNDEIKTSKKEEKKQKIPHKTLQKKSKDMTLSSLGKTINIDTLNYDTQTGETIIPKINVTKNNNVNKRYNNSQSIPKKTSRWNNKKNSQKVILLTEPININEKTKLLYKLEKDELKFKEDIFTINNIMTDSTVATSNSNNNINSSNNENIKENGKPNIILLMAKKLITNTVFEKQLLKNKKQKKQLLKDELENNFYRLQKYKNIIGLIEHVKNRVFTKKISDFSYETFNDYLMNDEDDKFFNQQLLKIMGFNKFIQRAKKELFRKERRNKRSQTRCYDGRSFRFKINLQNNNPHRSETSQNMGSYFNNNLYQRNNFGYYRPKNSLNLTDTTITSYCQKRNPNLRNKKGHNSLNQTYNKKYYSIDKYNSDDDNNNYISFPKKNLNTIYSRLGNGNNFLSKIKNQVNTNFNRYNNSRFNRYQTNYSATKSLSIDSNNSNYMNQKHNYNMKNIYESEESMSSLEHSSFEEEKNDKKGVEIGEKNILYHDNNKNIYSDAIKKLKNDENLSDDSSRIVIKVEKKTKDKFKNKAEKNLKPINVKDLDNGLSNSSILSNNLIESNNEKTNDKNKLNNSKNINNEKINNNKISRINSECDVKSSDLNKKASKIKGNFNKKNISKDIMKEVKDNIPYDLSCVLGSNITEIKTKMKTYFKKIGFFYSEKENMVKANRGSSVFEILLYKFMSMNNIYLNVKIKSNDLKKDRNIMRKLIILLHRSNKE